MSFKTEPGIYQEARENLKKIREIFGENREKLKENKLAKMLCKSSECAEAENLGIKFADEEFRNPVWIAASPITGAKKTKTLEEKIKFLWELGAGAIVLKSAYLEEEKKEFRMITRDIKAEMKTRVWREEKPGDRVTLFNTGRTLAETVLPHEIPEVVSGLKKIDVIPSIGSHGYNRKTWKKLFERLKEGPKLIEVNARHPIRRMIEESRVPSTTQEQLKRLNEYLKDADEYFSSSIPSSFYGFWSKFREWTRDIHRIGSRNGKKIIIKLPYRSDLNMLAWICESVEKEFESKFGIRALTLINTIKTPYWDYKDYDYPKIPMASGDALTDLRDRSLFYISKVTDLDISASGGIFSAEDILKCARMGASSVQLCTSVLYNGFYEIPRRLVELHEKLGGIIYYQGLRNGKSLIEKSRRTRKPLLANREVAEIDQNACKKCGKCFKTAYCDAIANRFQDLENLRNQLEGSNKTDLYDTPPDIIPDRCSGCGLCVLKCPKDAIKLELKSSKKYECPICGNEELIEYGTVEKIIYGCEKCGGIFKIE
ncbi:hypothetical protein AKJ43_01895 [candidate division MSBL1 archaeon SCGC-AAA261D19]|uniref:Dihydrothymine dehydrogenase n=1 Tax=candidate division MSBL1 archaeon SCGC-AAA261D19 TaxID=1698273 RepID=A0A133V7C6_9EURY|nr:hypothetical protein AKJ43_01895 [candidate division MSBL1 archaeon SCGC-AAA261D19]